MALIYDVVKIPVTHRAVQFGPFDSDTEIAELLEGTGASMGGSFSRYLTHRFDVSKGDTIANGPRMERVDIGDWIVVSSIGEVQALTDTQYKKEFNTA
jgi:hypothetical protein